MESLRWNSNLPHFIVLVLLSELDYVNQLLLVALVWLIKLWKIIFPYPILKMLNNIGLPN